MKSIKIIHMADIHIGRKYKNLTESKSALRQSEVLVTFENVINRFNDAEFVLISGDMFEEDCKQSDVRFVNSVFSKHSDKKFLISCGNHDCYESTPIKYLREHLPENVYIFGETIEKLTFDNLGLEVYGVSFSAPHSYTSLLAGFSAERNDYTKIMVMHGDISSDSSYNPITSKEIQNSGVIYMALGHIHSFSGIERAGNVFYAYPGVLEPGGFDELGECGVIYGEISRERVCLDFYPVSQREYIITEYDISFSLSHETIISDLKKLILERNSNKIIFKGQVKDFKPNVKLYEEALEGFFVEFSDETVIYDSILNYTSEMSLRGRTAQMLENIRGTVRPEVFDETCDILTELMCRD